MIHDDQQQKINRWNFARGLGDLTLDDLLSDSESDSAKLPITNCQLPITNPPPSDSFPSLPSVKPSDQEAA